MDKLSVKIKNSIPCREDLESVFFVTTYYIKRFPDMQLVTVIVKAWFSLATQAQECLFYRENGLDASISASTRIRIKIFACVAFVFTWHKAVMLVTALAPVLASLMKTVCLSLRTFLPKEPLALTLDVIHTKLGKLKRKTKRGTPTYVPLSPKGKSM